MIVVLDDSAAVNTVLNNENSYKKVLTKASRVIAPDLYISEITNIFWKYKNVANFDEEICSKMIGQSIGMIDDFFPSYHLYSDSFKLACKINHNVYDCMYLVLTQRNSAALATTDKKLMEIALKMSIDII